MIFELSLLVGARPYDCHYADLNLSVIGRYNLAKEKGRDREIRIVDRNAPRIAIQISEIRFDEKQRPATASLSRT